jgi:hypothetical protein
MVGGAGVCHLVGHGRGASERRQAEATGEGLGVPLPEPWRRGRRLLWWSLSERGSRQLHENAAWGKPYWGPAKKACNVDQYGASPMDGSKEDGQAGSTENPYWGAAKKVCDVDQYEAPPMDGLKDGQAGAPATAAVAQGPAALAAMPVKVPMAAATSMGPVAPAAGPAGALMPAVRKRRPTRGWLVTVPMAGPAEAPTMAAVAKESAASVVGGGVWRWGRQLL